MSLPSRQLFLDRFLEYNLERYKNDPDTLARLRRIKLSDIVFDGFAEDPDRPGSVISNFTVPTDAIEAYLQKWIPVDVKNENIIDPSNVTVVSDINDVIAANARGFFNYDDNGVTKLAVVMTFRQDIPIEELAKEVIKTINKTSNYVLKEDDLHINYTGSTDDYKLFDLLNETIVGEVTVIRLKNDILQGTPWLGYLGQWTPDEVIRPSILAEMVGMGANVINPDSDWLKFSVEGRIFYVAKKPISNLTSYTALSGLNLVEGNRVITLGYDQYKLKLLSGEDTDTSDWNRLMYRVSKDDPTETFWEEFTDAELGINTNIGGQTISRSTSGTSVYSRGRYGVKTIQANGKTFTNVVNGWRPVLEYVGVTDITYSPQVHMNEVVPVEPLISGGAFGDFVYSVGPVKARTDKPAVFSDYEYADIVYTIQGVIVNFIGSSTAIFSDFDIDAVKVVPSVISRILEKNATYTGHDIKDIVIVNTLGKTSIKPAWLDPDVKGAIADGIKSLVLKNSNMTLLPCSGVNNRKQTDSVAAGLPKSGKYVTAAEMLIESIEFTGIDMWIPETDYGDLFDEPVYNPATSFMSF